jgi:hypothetical protein
MNISGIVWRHIVKVLKSWAEIVTIVTTYDLSNWVVDVFWAPELKCTQHYAASRKVAGSSPDEVGFLNWPNPSGRKGPWGRLSL